MPGTTSGSGDALGARRQDGVDALEMPPIRRTHRYMMPLMTASIAEALDAADFVIVAVPSHGVRHVLALAAASVPASAIVVSATKGMEGESLLRMSEVVEAELGGPQRIAVMSGPSFALEVARQRPTAVSVVRATRVAAKAAHEFRGRYPPLHYG